MDPKDPAPGVSDPPPDPAAPAAPAPDEPPAGGDPVQSPSDPKEQNVPYSRFKEVNDKAKQNEERIARLESELESRQQPASTPEDEVDPDVLDLVRKSASKLGFISKEELDEREGQIQVRQDLNDLASHYKDSGIPFDGKAVIEYANANGMPIGSKKSLDAVYKEMNYDSIIEANRKAAIDSYQKGLKSGGEKPGSKGAQPPEQPKPANLKERIRMAREGAGFNIT